MTVEEVIAKLPEGWHLGIYKGEPYVTGEVGDIPIAHLRQFCDAMGWTRAAVYYADPQPATGPRCQAVIEAGEWWANACFDASTLAEAATMKGSIEIETMAKLALAILDLRGCPDPAPAATPDNATLTMPRAWVAKKRDSLQSVSLGWELDEDEREDLRDIQKTFDDALDAAPVVNDPAPAIPTQRSPVVNAPAPPTGDTLRSVVEEKYVRLCSLFRTWMGGKTFEDILNQSWTGPNCRNFCEAFIEFGRLLAVKDEPVAIPPALAAAIEALRRIRGFVATHDPSSLALFEVSVIDGVIDAYRTAREQAGKSLEERMEAAGFTTDRCDGEDNLNHNEDPVAWVTPSGHIHIRSECPDKPLAAEWAVAKAGGR